MSIIAFVGTNLFWAIGLGTVLLHQRQRLNHSLRLAELERDQRLLRGLDES